MYGLSGAPLTHSSELASAKGRGRQTKKLGEDIGLTLEELRGWNKELQKVREDGDGLQVIHGGGEFRGGASGGDKRRLCNPVFGSQGPEMWFALGTDVGT